MIDNRDPLSRLKAALQVIDSQRKILSDSKSDEMLVRDLSAIVRYLNSMSISQASHILEKAHRRGHDQKKNQAEDFTQAYNLNLDDIQSIIDSENVTRGELESIAVGRFQVPKGSLRSIGNMEQLKMKVSTLVQNERSHQTISKLAGDHKYK
ncbi:hypothetical protein [Methylorubrum thiocyanatum]|uniref:hypothetical protein n=1 Tax=Methylorubrum thiocyanatum TaxID=47958 RepID=UPI003F812DAB